MTGKWTPFGEGWEMGNPQKPREHDPEQDVMSQESPRELGGFRLQEKVSIQDDPNEVGIYVVQNFDPNKYEAHLVSALDPEELIVVKVNRLRKMPESY